MATTDLTHDPTEQEPDHAFELDSPHPLLDREALTSDERRSLLEEYVTRGRALRLHGDRGLVDSHRRRALNLGQFFTPSRAAHALAQTLGLADHLAWERAGSEWTPRQEGALVDFAGCGNGRLLQFAPPGWSRHGADIDPLACRAARLIYPDAEILEASLLDFHASAGSTFSAAVINPPFSVTLTNRRPLPLKCAEWGIWGRDTSATSHVAALELAANMAPVVGAILPTSFLDTDGEDTIAKIAQRHYGWGLKLRIDLPPNTFSEEGTEWPCSLTVFGTFDLDLTPRACDTWADVESAVSEWITLQAGVRCYQNNVVRALGAVDEPASLASWRVSTRPARSTNTSPAAGNDSDPTVRLCLGGRGHRIMLKANGRTAALAVQEARLHQGWKTSDGFAPQSMLSWRCDLVRNAGDATRAVQDVVQGLTRLQGLRVVVDSQLWTHARRADRRAAVEMTPFAQWVRRAGDTWEERWNDDLGPLHPTAGLVAGRRALHAPRAETLESGLHIKAWSRAQGAHVERTSPAFPIYAFARSDIVRVLGKRASIYSAKQGLGKTRFSIGAFLCSGMARGLWILETRLVNEFRRELKRLGLLGGFHQIDSKGDLALLRTFNVISYSRLWRPVDEGHEKRQATWGPGKSFAAALARRNLFIVVDEAHKIRVATSKQGVATRHLCNRSPRVLLMSGTAVSSYPRNILALVEAGWGDGSAMNPYGYRRPIDGGYSIKVRESTRHRKPLIRGTTKFIDEYVDVIYYTPAFEQTVSTGMKSREIPRIKDLPRWESFIRSKILRRVPGEPEVRASGVRTPEAHPEFVAVDPLKEHFAYYKLVLDHFAAIWKKRFEEEQKTGRRENSSAHILPELDALRFASTVPVVPHRWAEHSPALRYTSRAPTAIMLEAMKRIAAWVEAGDRVLVGAEKPDALRWLADLLSDLPTYVPDAEPIAAVLADDSNIKRRNALIDRVRDGGQDPVLLISVGMGKEGLNLPTFSKLLSLDLGWVPGDLDQFRHRILRPDQTGDVEIVHLFHRGLVDDYMRQLCEAKSDAISHCLDGAESRFDYTSWADLRTFCLRMLENEGYRFAAEMLARDRSLLAA
jgi:hypothetical protein